MSSNEKTVQYTALDVGDRVQEGDQWLDEHGQWQPYVLPSGLNRVVGYGVRARRPIPATGQVTYEEVPGSRTTQQAIDQPQREGVAYEELQPGDIIQEGDEWQNECGRWRPFLVLHGSRVQVRQSQRVRRPYNITQLQDERDKLRAEMDIVKGDRMNLREALAAEQRAHKVTMASGLQACSERDEACRERDLARAEVARLSTELWARKPLEDRVASLTEELAQAREASQQLLQTITDNADQFAEHTAALVQERDEARAKSDRLQGLIDDLLDEPTAKQVQDMLRTWATELDWSAGCFDSVGRDEIDTIQKTLVAVIERIKGLINPEGGTDGE